MNKVIITGNLTKTPEVRNTQSGKTVADLRLAINEKRRDSDETIFVDVTVWDRQAELCCEFLAKGSRVLIEGKLKQDNWEDKQTGGKRSKIGIVANRIEFIGSKQEPAQQYTRDQPHARNDKLDDDFNSNNVPF